MVSNPVFRIPYCKRRCLYLWIIVQQLVEGIVLLTDEVNRRVSDVVGVRGRERTKVVEVDELSISVIRREVKVS